LPATKAVIARIACFAAIASAVVAFGVMLPGLSGRVIYTAVALAIYAVVGWCRVLDPTDRAMLMQKLTRPRLKALAPGQAPS